MPSPAPIPTGPLDDPSDLRQRLAGDLLLPTDTRFAAAVAGFRSGSAPRLVVVAEDTDDVVAAVRYAAANGMTVAVGATGRGGTGSRADLLIVTARMNEVTIDPQHRRATVAAGTRWSAVIAAAAPHGLAPASGWSPAAGVVGETLGGGSGPLSRAVGPAADHAVRMTIVDGAGRLVEVDPASEPELFWAFRGGRSQVGVVTELGLGLVDPGRCYGGSLVYPGSASSSLVHAFRGWCRWLPERATASIALQRLPNRQDVPPAVRGRLTVRLRFMLAGGDDGPELLAPMRQVADALHTTIHDGSYQAMVSEPDLIGTGGWRDGALLGDFDTEAAEALLAVAGPDAEAPPGVIEIRQLGGAIGREPPGGSAVGGRAAAFALRLAGQGAPEHPWPPAGGDAGPFGTDRGAAAPDAGQPGDWPGSVLRAMAPWVSGRHVTLLGAGAGTDQVRRSWTPQDYLRLLRIKRRHDPADRFHFGHPLRDAARYPERATSPVDASGTLTSTDNAPTRSG